MFSTLAAVRSVSVILTSIHTRVDTPSTQLTYEVRNKGDRPVWLVDDGWLTWRQKGKQIELSYAREKMQPGAEVFGYFSPTVAKIEPGNAVTRKVELSWPLSLDRLWNDEYQAKPNPGKYKVSIKVGYGLTPEPGPLAPEESVETPVFRWQTSIVSNFVPMVVPVFHDPDKKRVSKI
jgi:hypothetical protein